MPDQEKSGARLSFEISDAEELAKYAFDQKVEESGMRVLRSRLYPLIVVITTILSTFGIGLTWWVNKVAARAESLNTAIAKADTELRALNGEIADFRLAAQDLTAKKAELELETRALASRRDLVESRSIAAISDAAAAQSSGAAAREMAVSAQAALSKALSDINRRSDELEESLATVQEKAEMATQAGGKIQAIRKDAEDFAAAVKKHRELVAATIVDSITLRSQDSSEISVPDLTGGDSFRIRFKTGSIEKKKRFDIVYTVNDGQPRTVKVSSDDTRRPIPIDGTNGQYQFTTEFIYSAWTVPDFVTIRISGIPRPAHDSTIAGAD